MQISSTELIIKITDMTTSQLVKNLSKNAVKYETPSTHSGDQKTVGF